LASASPKRCGGRDNLRLNACIASFFSYETTKSVVVKSWTLGLINRIVQLLILAYFIGWVFLHEKAYQVQDTAIESSVVTKVKGSGVYNKTIMDITDLVSPPQVSDTFARKLILIEHVNNALGFTQTFFMRHKPWLWGAVWGVLRKNDLGSIMTGRCVNSSNSVDSFCEVKGWCPTENDTVTTQPTAPSIPFRGNLQPDITQDFLKTCSFHTQDNIYCPIFKVGDVLRFAQQDFYSIAKHGGVVAIKIGWVCDLDKSEEFCNPSYSFVRLDKKNNVSKGYNFRYAKYYKAENGTKYRTLIKAIAIRFDVIVYGAVSLQRISHVPFVGPG
uniref:Purinergic receptor P2X, ligand-gated ion channel, 3a n=1 Tax=Scleropages formosus TaxID=113540 RepID=A0A8C9TZT3_SCLFO